MIIGTEPEVKKTDPPQVIITELTPETGLLTKIVISDQIATVTNNLIIILARHPEEMIKTGHVKIPRNTDRVIALIDPPVVTLIEIGIEALLNH